MRHTKNKNLTVAWLVVVFGLFGVGLTQAQTDTFGFDSEQVAEQWQTLTGGMRGDFPSPQALRAEADRYPALLDETLKVLQQNRDDPLLAGLTLDLSDGDYEVISRVVIKAWAAFFNGDFQGAYALGRKVGPPGLFPALYARAVQGHYVETDAARREQLLREVMEETARLLETQPEHAFARFGNAYAKARLIEPMGALAARRTGYMEEIQAALDELLADDPDNLYALSLQGGLYSGIIDKAGAWLARRRFGVTAEMVDQVFERAQTLNPGYASPYLEYAVSMERVWGDERREQITATLRRAAEVDPVSAEEALASDKARQLLAQ